MAYARVNNHSKTCTFSLEELKDKRKKHNNLISILASHKFNYIQKHDQFIKQLKILNEPSVSLCAVKKSRWFASRQIFHSYKRSRRINTKLKKTIKDSNMDYTFITTNLQLNNTQKKPIVKTSEKEVKLSYKPNKSVLDVLKKVKANYSINEEEANNFYLTYNKARNYY